MITNYYVDVTCDGERDQNAQSTRIYIPQNRDFMKKLKSCEFFQIRISMSDDEKNFALLSIAPNPMEASMGNGLEPKNALTAILDKSELESLKRACECALLLMG